MIKQIIDFIRFGSLKYRQHNMDLLMKLFTLSMDLTSKAVALNQLNKCFKCRHEFEEKECFQTGGLIIKKERTSAPVLEPENIVIIE